MLPGLVGAAVGSPAAHRAVALISAFVGASWRRSGVSAFVSSPTIAEASTLPSSTPH